MRPINVDEMDLFQRVEGAGFGYIPTPEDIAHWQATLDFARTLAAFEDGALVGTSAALALETTVPGGAAVATAGITMVAVSPAHRRRGILTELMRGLLTAAHERDEPLATLWASESPIYPHFGYGLAIEDEAWSIERPFARFAHAPASAASVRLVDAEFARARFPEVWERARRERVGMTGRTDQLWNDRLSDRAHERGGATAYFFVACEDGGRLDGYALYRVRQAWPDGLPSNEIIVVEAIGATDAAHAALWRFLLDLDLSRPITAQHRPLDDPLPLMLADVRRLKRHRRDAIWLRFVDTRRALEVRAYAAAGALTLEVRDDFCPWNPARLHLEAGPEGARCAPTDAAPDLVLGAADLAATYLGGTRFTTLARAGRAEERRAGALRTADALFATEHAAWSPQFF